MFSPVSSHYNSGSSILDQLEAFREFVGQPNNKELQ